MASLTNEALAELVDDPDATTSTLDATFSGGLAGGELSELAEGLTDFTGVRRRFEFRGTAVTSVG